MHLFYRVCYVVFFKVAIEMDDQRLLIYLFLSDIVDEDDEVFIVDYCYRKRLTRGFQRITFFLASIFKTNSLKCPMAILDSKMLLLLIGTNRNFYASLHEQHKPLFPESLEKKNQR